jgi:hypothetical protein
MDVAFLQSISQIGKRNELWWPMGSLSRVNGNGSAHLSEHSMQQPGNSISKHIAPEAHQTDVFEQCPPSLGSRGNRTQLLSGWKEIANYMHQGVRTVQRWEAIGLPVRRVKNRRRGPVIAFAEDLDAWARSLHVPLLDRIEELRATISSLEAEIRSLKRQLWVGNRPAHIDTIPGSYALTQQSQTCASRALRHPRSNKSSQMEQ